MKKKLACLVGASLACGSTGAFAAGEGITLSGFLTAGATYADQKVLTGTTRPVAGGVPGRQHRKHGRLHQRQPHRHPAVGQGQPRGVDHRPAAGARQPKRTSTCRPTGRS
ncbi:MAG: hypothetical protein MZV65_33495 [Chromatiales bacterium]|nr:hypothetical protein [Chromatiales bacterium]